MSRLTPVRDLPIAEQDAGAAAVEAAFGEAPPLSILSRLHRDESGAWQLSYRVCNLTASSFDPRMPFSLAPFRTATAFDPATMGSGGGPLPIFRHVETKYGPIADVLRMLADGVEKDIARYDKLQAESDAWGRQRREEFAAEMAKQEERRRVEAQQRVDFRFDGWLAIPALAQAFYLLALAVDEGKGLAAALRNVAETLSRTNPRFPWPTKKWW